MDFSGEIVDFSLTFGRASGIVYGMEPQHTTTGAIENPIRRIRTKEGKSLVEFGEDCGVQFQALYLNECGVYPHILPSILAHLTRLGYDNHVELQREYNEFVTQKRGEAYFKFDLGNYTLPPPTGVLHPILALRETIAFGGLSRIGFAKAFCVHPASLYKLEFGDSQHLPAQLRVALLEAGLPDTVVDELDFRIGEWADGVWEIAKVS